jgi:hypothetical protein
MYRSQTIIGVVAALLLQQLSSIDTLFLPFSILNLYMVIIKVIINDCSIAVDVDDVVECAASLIT